MGLFNREKKKIETVYDFANASKEEQEDTLNKLNRTGYPQLNIQHTLDWEKTSQNIYGGNQIQADKDQDEKQ